MGWYRGPIFTEALDGIEPVRDSSVKPLRFPVQDVLSIDGRDVVIGRIEAGTIRQGQEVIALPERHRTTVLEVIRFGERRSKACAGESIGVVLGNHYTVGRGTVLVQQEDEPGITDELSVTMFWMAEEPLNRGSELSLQCATQEVACLPIHIIQRLDSSTLDLLEENGSKIYQNDVGFMKLRMLQPVVCELFSFIPEMGRIVLRKGDEVQGAGIVGGSEER
jgi:bifunctional enzyme CysN/CysC/sulfate adenylyltransferase subunit 1